MSIQSGRALNNVLLRRVQRHQSMSTLFHSHPHPVPSTYATQVPQQPEASPVTQAKPMDIQTPTQPDLPREQSSPKATAVRQVAPLLPVDAPLNETKATTSPVKDEPAKPDPGWKRLQTIFRRHQEQENPTTESFQLPEPAAAINLNIQRKTEQAEHTNMLGDTQQREIQDVPQPTQASPLIQRKTNTAETHIASKENVALKPENQAQAPETQIPQTDQSATSLPETAKTKINQESDRPNSKINSPNELPINFEEPAIEEEPRELNTLPLESVWNVQRTEEPEPTEQPVSRTMRQHQTPMHSASSAQVLQRSELESNVSASGLQNESKLTERLQAESGIDADGELEFRAPVEVLAPSRPRPAPVNSVKPGAAIQKQAQDQSPASELNEDQMIETAIGSLPADLWQLIGQKPPESKSSQSTPEAMSSSIPQQTENIKPQQEMVKHETTSQPVRAIKMVDFPAAVQREPLATDTSSTEQPREISVSSSQQNIESELDVDELARKVYARIRQRLSTEWERLRRR